MLDVLISGSAGSNLLEVRGKDMVKNNFEPKGGLGFKDARLMLDSAERLQVMMPMMGLYKQLMLKALYQGWGKLYGTVVMSFTNRGRIFDDRRVLRLAERFKVKRI